MIFDKSKKEVPPIPVPPEMRKNVRKEFEVSYEAVPKAQNKKRVPSKMPVNKLKKKDFPTLQLKSEKDIAMDFSAKVYRKFDKLVKSVVLFGSSVKNTAVEESDIDIVIIIDDAAISWDLELISWYREELGKIIMSNPYNKELHINTVKLTAWWQDLLRGDPVVMNILRYGEPLIDFGGFFNPLKVLLQQGKIRSTPEAVYNCLQRAPMHLARSNAAELGAVEGIYWAMVDSAHALLISAEVTPPSPEHIPALLRERFVDRGLLNTKYVKWYKDLFSLHKQIAHGNIRDVKGIELDEWQARADEFIRAMAELINSLIEKNKK
jgi:predicted nucleotidyltransferase/uncharacterized protein (UPF0332 family)